MTTFAEPMVRDELDGVVSNMCTKFPHRSRSEVETVVATVYADLAAHAKVTAHLIPLTLNKSRRLLAVTPPDGNGDPHSTSRRTM